MSSLITGGLGTGGLISFGLGVPSGGSRNQPNYPTSLDKIGYAFQAMIQAANIAPSIQAVIFSDLAQPFPAQGYPQVVLSRGSFTPVPGWWEGGGLYTSCLQGLIRVTVNTELALDEAQQNQYLLLGNPNTDPVIAGLELMSHKINNVLHGKFLLDSNGNYLSIQPISIASSPTPENYGETNPGWEGISTTFNLMFLPDYTLPG